MSGGIDSAVTLAQAKDKKFKPQAISFDYGQRHKVELDSAKKVAAFFEIEEHLIFPIDLTLFGSSALTSDIAVPKDRPIFDKKPVVRESSPEKQEALNYEQSPLCNKIANGKRYIPASCGIPVTYVPARNTIFLSVALAFAEVTASRDIFIGANAVDYSGYPDCRPEFLEVFEKMANLATSFSIGGPRIKIHAPLMYLSKAEIIKKGEKLGVDFSLTHSCYDPTPEGLHCGRCDSCQYRKKGFIEAKIADPTRYAQ